MQKSTEKINKVIISRKIKL